MPWLSYRLTFQKRPTNDDKLGTNKIPAVTTTATDGALMKKDEHNSLSLFSLSILQSHVLTIRLSSRVPKRKEEKEEEKTLLAAAAMGQWRPPKLMDDRPRPLKSRLLLHRRPAVTIRARRRRRRRTTAYSSVLYCTALYRKHLGTLFHRVQ